MKITFEAANARELVEQLTEFVEEFHGEFIEELVPPIPKEPKPEPIQKKKPGRPAKSEVVLPKVESEPPPVVAQVSAAAHAVTKEDLTLLMQKILEKGGPNPEAQGSQITVIRNIFKEFGIGKLGELDAKRYHEIKVKFEEVLK